MLYDGYGGKMSAFNALLPIYDGDYSELDCKNKFLALMAAKASVLGMASTTYASPSGMTTSNVSTPQDLMKLGVAVCGNKEALNIWHTPSSSFEVYGPNARTLTVTNGIIDAAISSEVNDLKSYYNILGSKGGALAYSNNTYYRAQICCVEVKNRPAILSVMGNGETSYNNIFKSCKELADMISAMIDGTTPTAGTNLTELISSGGGYAGCIVPNIPEAFNYGYSAADFAARADVIKDGQTSLCKLASTTKVMTMMCALDYISDPNAIITVKSGDIEGGSGSTFYDGDILRVGDALRIMMMQSSNTLAWAVGRTIGGYALQLEAAS